MTRAVAAVASVPHQITSANKKNIRVVSEGLPARKLDKGKMLNRTRALSSLFKNMIDNNYGFLQRADEDIYIFLLTVFSIPGDGNCFYPNFKEANLSIEDAAYLLLGKRMTSDEFKSLTSNKHVKRLAPMLSKSFWRIDKIFDKFVEVLDQVSPVHRAAYRIQWLTLQEIYGQLSDAKTMEWIQEFTERARDVVFGYDGHIKAKYPT